MAARSIRAPSASTDPSSCTYHVFLSFRGADTRTSFTDFLYEALVRAEFRTFRDDNEIRRGKRIEPEIRRGIEESKLFIIVLSKGYASSEWCLDELAMIMERERIDRCVVLPVFYDVDPDQVSGQTHCYAEAFAGHKEKFEEDRVEGWRKALTDVANIAGLELRGRSQSKFVEEIVEKVRENFGMVRVAEHQPMKRLKSSDQVYGSSSFLGGNTDLRYRGEQLGSVAEEAPAELVAELPCDATIGMEEKFNEVWSCLEDKSVGIIGLYGIGGVGKTTLLTQIRNRFVDLYNNFVVIWIVVGKNSNFEKIQADVGKEIGVLQGSTRDKKVSIYNKLLRKKFVLLLDDIWERVRLDEIGIPPREKLNGSKIMFTTRSLKMCGEMLAQKKIRIETLEWKYAWELFKRYVGEDTIDDPEVLSLAMSMAKTCDGLPIALKTIGRAMSCKTGRWEWHNAMDSLKKPALQLQSLEDEFLKEMEDEVFSLLKFSFDSLPNEKVKSCFLFCALFPDGYYISRDLLSNYWICEDMGIGRSHSQQYSIISTLVHLCLLEENGSFVRLHDVVRDMALWIQRKDTLVITKMTSIEEPIVERWEEVRKLSLMENNIEKLTQVPTCPKLEILLLKLNLKLNEINEHFFQFMSTLTILDLSHTAVKKLPRSIVHLVSLQYLDISYTQILELSAGLTKLEKLKHLGLRNLCLKFNKSEKIISCLSSLEVIYMWNCSYNYLEKKAEIEREDKEGGGEEETEEEDGEEKDTETEEEEEHIEEEEQEEEETEEEEVENRISVDGEILFEELLCLKHLNSLGITISCWSTLKRFSSNQKMMSVTKSLCLTDFRGVKLLNICFLANMKFLVEFGIGDCDFNKIQVDCTEVEGTQAISSLQLRDISFHCLQKVGLKMCPHLRDLTWLIFVPNLTYLYVYHCHKLEEIISDEKLAEVVDLRCQNVKPFSKLATLGLYDLPQLKCIYSSTLHFLFLATFVVRSCPVLKKLPLGSNSKKGCKIQMNVEEEWWESIEWEDDATKAALFPRFRIYFETRRSSV